MSKIAVGVRVFHETIGQSAMIREVRGDNKFKVNWDDGTGGKIWWHRDDFIFDNSCEGPVRTVTRREIVRGRYGDVRVGGVEDGTVMVAVNHSEPLSPMTADELDAAALTLQQLAEALRAQ